MRNFIYIPARVSGDAIRGTPVTVHKHGKSFSRENPRHSSHIRETQRAGHKKRISTSGSRSSPQSRKIPKSLSLYRNGFKFDPFPPKIATARPTPSEVLENPELEATDAQRRNVELGRSLIARHGSADAALQALDAVRNERSFRSYGYKLSYKQQQLGIYQAMHEMSEGVKKLEASLKLKMFLEGVSNMEYMNPFRQFIASDGDLSQLLCRAPLQSVRKKGFAAYALSEELRYLVENLGHIWQLTYGLSALSRRFYTAKHLSMTATQPLEASTYSLMRLLSAPARRNMFHMLEAVRAGSRPTMWTIAEAHRVLNLCHLRRQAGNCSQQQNIFNALHHHFKSFRPGQNSLIFGFNRAIIGARRTQYHSGRKGPPLPRKRAVIDTVLRRLHWGTMAIFQVYHEEFLPLWNRSIQVMSSRETERQNWIAQKYWLACFQNENKSSSYTRELYRISDELRILRLQSLGASWTAFQHNRTVLESATARLSEIHASLRKPAAFTANLSLKISAPKNLSAATQQTRGTEHFQPIQYSTGANQDHALTGPTSSQRISSVRTSISGNDQRSDDCSACPETRMGSMHKRSSTNADQVNGKGPEPSTFRQRYEATCSDVASLPNHISRLNTDINNLVHSLPKRARPEKLSLGKMQPCKYIYDSLVEIHFRRLGFIGDYQQSVFGSLDYHFVRFSRDGHRDIARAIHWARLTYQSSFTGERIISPHATLIRDQLVRIQSLIHEICRLYCEGVLPLWEQHVSFMSPQELNRHNQVAQCYWSIRVRQPVFDSRSSLDSKLNELPGRIHLARRVFAASVRSKSKAGKAAPDFLEARGKREDAIEAMLWLERLSPSKSPMNEHALRDTLRLSA